MICVTSIYVSEFTHILGICTGLYSDACKKIERRYLTNMHMIVQRYAEQILWLIMMKTSLK